MHAAVVDRWLDERWKCMRPLAAGRWPQSPKTRYCTCSSHHNPHGGSLSLAPLHKVLYCLHSRCTVARHAKLRAQPYCPWR